MCISCKLVFILRKTSYSFIVNTLSDKDIRDLGLHFNGVYTFGCRFSPGPSFCAI